MIRDVTVVPMVDAGTVEVLERALVQARSGEIGAVAVAVVFRDGGMQAHYHFGNCSTGMLLGSLERCRHKLHEDLDGRR